MPVLVVGLTLEPDRRLCLESPFDRAFVDGLKQAIPWDGREWLPDRRRWLILPLYEDLLLAFLRQWGCQVKDDRPRPVPVVPPAESGALVPVPEMPVKLRAAFDALRLQYHAPLCVAEAAFRAYCKYFHPDKGGDPEQFHAVNDAIKIIRAALGDDETDESDTENPV